MIYKENPKGSINKTKQKNPRRIISEFSKVIGYKVNIESIITWDLSQEHKVD